MASTQKLYPRATVKRIVKAHSKKNVSKDLDILVFLDYTLFLQTLLREASIEAKQSGQRAISANDVRKVTEDALRKFKGYNSSEPSTFPTYYQCLLRTHGAPLLPPSHPHSARLSHSLASLSLHPTLEAALHLLNADLPSAHFLVRHMQAPPAYEGMFLHGILHRVEGDYENARAWYESVSQSEVFRRAWGDGEEGKEEAWGFLGRVERLKKEGEGDKEELEKESRREIEAVVDWCVQRFGTGKWEDASGVWTRPDEKVRSIGQDMVTGDKGLRQF
ncbi:MAG: hypothetical protein M1816_002552 [Peltula sp. TS41687]|nr:MAG: hypothetical protein M1816_002552 [Peltula sp. TS41687]